MSFVRRLKDTIEPTYKCVYRLCVKLFRVLPVCKNKIVFIQGDGEGYRCNLKYIAQEIIRQGLDYDLVWLVEFKDTVIPAPIRKVKYNRIRAVYELATAKVLINNSKSLYPVSKKPGQTFIYVPHGQPGCKCAEGDANLSPEWIRSSKQHSALTDVFISMGRYHTQVLKDTFWVPEHAQIWEVGFPRNDNYYRDTEARQKEIRAALNVPEGMRIVFYSPTFRDSGKTDAYDLDLHRVLKTLEQKTGDPWMFFITYHGCFKWFEKPVYDFGTRIWNVADYEDIHELLLIADVAISDYSSVALDFANTRKPVFLYASDIEDYTRMRGLKAMYYQLPFPLAKTNEEMEQNILNFDYEAYKYRFEAFMKEPYDSVDDGQASYRFVENLKVILR